jgi:hypothetical protein
MTVRYDDDVVHAMANRRPAPPPHALEPTEELHSDPYFSTALGYSGAECKSEPCFTYQRFQLCSCEVIRQGGMVVCVGHTVR